MSDYRYTTEQLGRMVWEMQNEINGAGMGDPRDRELAELRAEVERLRAAAQAVIDSINDENEIDPDAIFRLSQALTRPKEC